MAENSECTARELTGSGLRGAPRCRLIMRFYKGKGTYQAMAAQFVSSPVHVDYVLDKENSPHRRVCFSAYMREKFSMTLMPHEMVHDPLYDNWAVDITESDFERLYDFLHGMVDKTPYNYSDSLMLLPTIPHGGTFVDTLVTDLDRGITPCKISSVFCSQAGVLACRECIKDSPWLGGLVERLLCVNSRLCSPFDLLSIVRPYASGITNAELECVVDS